MQESFLPEKIFQDWKKRNTDATVYACMKDNRRDYEKIGISDNL